MWIIVGENMQQTYLCQEVMLLRVDGLGLMSLHALFLPVTAIRYTRVQQRLRAGAQGWHKRVQSIGTWALFVSDLTYTFTTDAVNEDLSIICKL